MKEKLMSRGDFMRLTALAVLGTAAATCAPQKTPEKPPEEGCPPGTKELKKDDSWGGYEVQEINDLAATLRPIKGGPLTFVTRYPTNQLKSYQINCPRKDDRNCFSLNRRKELCAGLKEQLIGKK